MGGRPGARRLLAARRGWITLSRSTRSPLLNRYIVGRLLDRDSPSLGVGRLPLPVRAMLEAEDRLDSFQRELEVSADGASRECRCGTQECSYCVPHNDGNENKG